MSVSGLSLKIDVFIIPFLQTEIPDGRYVSIWARCFWFAWSDSLFINEIFCASILYLHAKPNHSYSMNPKTFKSIVYAACGSMIAGCAAEPETAERPNMLFIMSDDHAYQAVSAYHDDLMQTLNIDRFANEGAIFTRASVTNYICAPSRAVMLSGKQSFVNGKVDNHSSFDWDQMLFPNLLQENCRDEYIAAQELGWRLQVVSGNHGKTWD